MIYENIKKEDDLLEDNREEMACDERVIQKMEYTEGGVYLETLLLCSTWKRRNFVYPLAFGETGIKERVKFMATYKKPTWKMMLVACLTCFVVVACLGTSKQPNSEIEETTEGVTETVESTTNGVIYEVEKIELVEGDTAIQGTTWVIGETANAMIFTANGSSDKVSRLKMDGVQMYKNAYTLGEDALTITLQSAYLDRLSVGEHILTIVYEDGEASITFVVEEKEVETEELIITDEMLENREENLSYSYDSAIARGYEEYYVVEDNHFIYEKYNPPMTIYLCERNHSFKIFLSTFSSQQPSGTYEKTDTELILHEYMAMHMEPFVFDIEGDAIKFNAEKSSDYFGWEDGKTFFKHEIPQDQMVEVNFSDFFHVTLPEGVTVKQANRANTERGNLQWLLQLDKLNEEPTVENAWISAGWFEFIAPGTYIYENPEYLALGCDCYDFTYYDFGALGTCEFDVSHILDKPATSKFWGIYIDGCWAFFNQEYFTEEEVIQIGEMFSIVME